MELAPMIVGPIRRSWTAIWSPSNLFWMIALSSAAVGLAAAQGSFRMCSSLSHHKKTPQALWRNVLFVM
jgi:hypothetical protein